MEEKLRRLQLTQLAILVYVDKFCRKHKIKYSLYAGTLLGAVRHKGFIPWDDDLDIVMPREDYERFIDLWEKEKHQLYFLQNKENEPNFTQSFTKIRKKNTNFLQQDDLGRNYHTGIFIDVFPIDRIPKGKYQKQLFKLYCMIYQLMTREFMPEKSNKFVKSVALLILKLTNSFSRDKIRKYVFNKIKASNTNKSLKMITIEVMRTLNVEYPSDLFDNLCELEFENRKFSCVSQWDIALKSMYGNYMILPPKEERMWKHKPLIIDFENCPEGYEDDKYA